MANLQSLTIKPTSYRKQIYDTICKPTFHPLYLSFFSPSFVVTQISLPLLYRAFFSFPYLIPWPRFFHRQCAFPSLHWFSLCLAAVRSIFRLLHLSSLMFVRFISPRSFLVTRPLVFLPSRPILLPCTSFTSYFFVISYC